MNNIKWLTLVFSLLFISEVSQADKVPTVKEQFVQSNINQQEVKQSQQPIDFPSQKPTADTNFAIHLSVILSSFSDQLDRRISGLMLGNRSNYDLIKAAKEGDLERVSDLIAHGANVNIRDVGSVFPKYIRHPSWTPLMYAASRDDLEMTKLLARLGADINQESYRWAEPSVISAHRWTALSLATYHKYIPNIDLIDFLIKSGARFDSTSNLSKQILDHAFNYNVYTILTSSDLINGIYRGRTELMFASYRGDIKTVISLLNEGVDVNARDSHGWTAFMIASFEGRVEITHLLNLSGANFTSEDYQILLNAGMEKWHYGFDAEESFMK